MSRWLKLLLPGLAIFIVATGFAGAEEVALDEEFGDDGLVITELGSRGDQATSIGVQDDGRIVVAGSSDNGLGSKMAVIRYLPDGTVDNEFNFTTGGSLGAVYADDGVNAVEFGENGSILLGGTLTVDGYRQGVIVRLLTNGQQDVSFGTNGIAYLDLEAADSEITDLVIDQQQRIVVAGFIAEAEKEHPLVARFDQNGGPDLSFNENGIVIDTAASGRANGLAERADGTVVVGGFALSDEGWNGLYLAAFLGNGELDSEFGDAGRTVWFDDVEQVIVHDLAIGLDEKIILAGEVEQSDGQHRFMLARYGKDGQPDPDFGEDGILVHDTGLDSSVHSIVVHPDGTIIGAGYQQTSTGKDTAIIRYVVPVDVDGLVERVAQESLAGELQDDPLETIKIGALSIEDGPMNIAVEGAAAAQYEADLITTELAGSDEIGNDILLTEDGSIYTVGSSGDETDSAFMVARYSGVVGDGYPVGSTEVTSTQFYRIGTMPVTGVTRVGATTGGNIVINGGGEDADCFEQCEESCDEPNEEDNASCLSACQENCLIPTVTERGVVYSVDPGPIYDDGSEGGEGGGDDGDNGEVVDPPAEDDDEQDDGDSEGLDRFFKLDDYYVLEGQTSDGSGTGIYQSEIEGVNPQTIYYVRAYALLSDGSVIYGNEYQFRTRDSCFIATAAFGSVDMFAVRALRMFRDQYLIPYDWGKSAVQIYYTISPAIADFIEQSVMLRILIMVLLSPAVVGALFLVYTTLLVKCLILAAPVTWYLINLRQKGYGIVHE